jgi:hypothetical protein
LPRTDEVFIPEHRVQVVNELAVGNYATSFKDSEPLSAPPSSPVGTVHFARPVGLAKGSSGLLAGKRRKLITVPARVATSARRITLHLPKSWPWETAWAALFDRVSDPPPVRAA